MTTTGLRGRSFVCAMQLSGENKHAVVFVAAPVAAAACAAQSSSERFIHLVQTWARPRSGLCSGAAR